MLLVFESVDNTRDLFRTKHAKEFIAAVTQIYMFRQTMLSISLVLASNTAYRHNLRDFHVYEI